MHFYPKLVTVFFSPFCHPSHLPHTHKVCGEVRREGVNLADTKVDYRRNDATISIVIFSSPDK